MSLVALQDGPFRAEVIADSVVRLSGQPYRITTIAVDVWRSVLAEFNTHRMFSRNAGSSRAIPVVRSIERLRQGHYVPSLVPLAHSGMQASSWVQSGDQLYEEFVERWLRLMETNISEVEYMAKELGISKQLLNRPLEPWQLVKVLVTATDWENFTALRVNENAQLEMMITARLILNCLNSSTPIEKQGGEWHVPFGDRLDQERLQHLWFAQKEAGGLSIEELARCIAMARCARVSYFNFEGKDDYAADVDLFNRLLSSGHMSPMEHVARAMTEKEYDSYYMATPEHVDRGRCDNLHGFISYRSMVKGENRSDPRIKRV